MFLWLELMPLGMACSLLSKWDTSKLSFSVIMTRLYRLLAQEIFRQLLLLHFFMIVCCMRTLLMKFPINYVLWKQCCST